MPLKKDEDSAALFIASSLTSATHISHSLRLFPLWADDDTPVAVGLFREALYIVNMECVLCNTNSLGQWDYFRVDTIVILHND